MSESQLSEMHRDHREWRSESALWHDQLREWEREIGEALGDLAKAERALREHQRKLQVHAAAIRLYEHQCGGHEHHLATSAQSGVAEVTAVPTSGHCVEAYDHARQRDLHESLKRTHHSLIARWILLLRALDNPTK